MEDNSIQPLLVFTGFSFGAVIGFVVITNFLVQTSSSTEAMIHILGPALGLTLGVPVGASIGGTLGSIIGKIVDSRLQKK